MSTQATRLNVRGMDAVTLSNEDLNMFRIVTSRLLCLLTLPWSIVSLTKPLLNCRTATHRTLLSTGANDVYTRFYFSINVSCNWAVRLVHLAPDTHTHTRTHTDPPSTSTSCNKMSCYATSQWLKGNSVPFSLQMITLVSAQCSSNRILSDK